MAPRQDHAVGRDAQPELDEKALEAAYKVYEPFETHYGREGRHLLHRPDGKVVQEVIRAYLLAAAGTGERERLNDEEIEALLDWTEGDSSAEECGAGDARPEDVCFICSARAKLKALASPSPVSPGGNDLTDDEVRVAIEAIQAVGRTVARAAVGSLDPDLEKLERRASIHQSVIAKLKARLPVSPAGREERDGG